nr:MAG TPA: hypothetical protein [Caudoviricetes sp.]
MLAGLRAHYPEHQHKKKRKKRKKRKTNNKTAHQRTAIPQPTTQHNKTTHTTTHKELTADSKHHTPHTTHPSTQHKPSPLFHNDTTLSQRHNPKPTML